MIKLIYQHSYWILAFGALLIGFASATLIPLSGLSGSIPFLGIFIELSIAIVIFVWVIIARRLQQASRAYAYFFLGCATLIWMLEAKIVFDLSGFGSIRITGVVMIIKAMALALITFGWFLWASDYRYLVTERHEQHKPNASLDDTDALTGLFNRARFDKTMEILANENAQYSLIIFDLDKFTEVNSRFGSAVGDIVIEQFAAQIKRNIRARDYAFRLGGEEFAVLLKHCPEARVKSIVQAILQGTRQNAFTTDSGRDFFVTTSAGVCVDSGQDSPSKVYRRADAALYQAKQDGRDRIVYA